MQDKKSVRVALWVKLWIMFTVILLLSTVTLGIVAYRIASQSISQNVYDKLSAISNDVAGRIADSNNKHFTALHFLAEQEFIKSEEVSLAEKNRQLVGISKASNGAYGNVAFYDKDGNTLRANGTPMNFADCAYFKESFAGKDYVSDPTLSPVTNSILQHYGVPVRNNDGKIIGSLVLVVSGNRLYDVISEVDLGGGMHPAVINYAAKTTIANANENTDENDNVEVSDDESGLGLVLNHVFEGREDIEDFYDENIRMHMIASYKIVPNTTWTVFGVANYDLFFRPLERMHRLIVIVVVLSIILSTILVFIFVRMFFSPLKTVKSSITTIASGSADLTQRIPVASNDEIGDVVQGFNNFVEKLQGIVVNLLGSKAGLQSVDKELQESTQDASSCISEIIGNMENVNAQILNQAGSVNETADAVSEISATIASLDKMIESQSGCVSQAALAVDEMVGNINSVNDSVDLMISSFKQLTANSETGTSTQINANEKIKLIEEQSKMLQDANIAIANIAEQTNLLAMNAAIEAAHAGEAGKGFAVVADEIRKLSETSAVQSKSIGAELKKIQDTIKEVVTVSNETNTMFGSISKSIEETSRIIGQIKGAMEEQQNGSKKITEALRSMNLSTSDVKNASEEMTEGNKHILTEMEKLQSATEAIKESISGMHTGASRINRMGETLSAISGKVADNIQKIGSEIDLFKV